MTIEEIAILLHRAWAKASFIKFQTPLMGWDDLATANKAVWIAVANETHRRLMYP
jgi:hypothetical protein